MQYVLDSIVNQAGIHNLGMMTIENLQYPATVEPNTPFTISYNARNTTTTTLQAFGYIYDFGTQNQIPNSYWEQTIPAGNSIPIQIQFSGITQTFSGEIRIGHMEEVPCSSYTSPETCLAAGCYWWASDNKCHNTEESLPCSAYDNNPNDCVKAGCYYDWETNKCTSTPGGVGINPLFIVAAIAAVGVVGIMFLVGKK